MFFSIVGRILPGLAAAIVIASIHVGDSGETLTPYGIWTSGEVIVLFAEVSSCPPNELPPPGAAQVLVSKDGGKHWEKSGQQFEGSILEYTHETGANLWIVGEHTAEGPASSPFILIPTGTGLDWKQKIIYEGNAELEGIAKRDNGDFVAWIRHLDLHGEGWTGPLYLHRSSDGGHTWHVVGRTKKTPDGPGAGFKKIEKQNSNWRVTDAGDDGSAVEFRADEHSSWREVYRFLVSDCGP